MKKIISLIVILAIITLCVPVYADSLQNVVVNVTKSTLNPNDEVKVDISFGQDLGSYTVDIAYDNKLLEYVSSEGGTANDNGTRVRVYYFDSQGGTNPRNNMSVTFKAKDVTTSNPTNFSITAEGLANSDASVNYDDIVVPITKEIVVEPKYVDYDISLKYTGDVLINEEKNMELSISSPMGKNYEHTRILAEATTPANGTIKLIGTDESQQEHDIIQSGWGDASGDPIGGKNVSKVLNLKGIFDKTGNYTVKIKLIDRDTSDAEIVSKTFNINVKEKQEDSTTNNTTNNNTNNNATNDNITLDKEENNLKEDLNTEKPETLPKTGSTIYLASASIIAALFVSYLSIKKNSKEK